MLFYFNANWRASETLRVENGKLRYVRIDIYMYIFRYVRHQNVARAQCDVRWAELSLNRIWE